MVYDVPKNNMYMTILMFILETHKYMPIHNLYAYMLHSYFQAFEFKVEGNFCIRLCQLCKLVLESTLGLAFMSW